MSWYNGLRRRKEPTSDERYGVEKLEIMGVEKLESLEKIPVPAT